MSDKIDLKDLTIEQMRQLKQIRLPQGLKGIITTNTYYKILRRKNYMPQQRTLRKLAKAFDISIETLLCQLENQQKQL